MASSALTLWACVGLCFLAIHHVAGVGPQGLPTARTPSDDGDDNDDSPTHSGGQDNDKCVDVRTSRYSYESTSVATCDYGDYLENAVSELAGELEEARQNFDETFFPLNDTVTQLQEEVDDLAGRNGILNPVGFTNRGFTAVVCEYNTVGEVSELCKTVGFPNPDVYFFHRPCSDEPGNIPCDYKNFIKLRPNCFRPNDPDLFSPPGFPVQFQSALYDCYQYPVDENDTCTKWLHVSCEGYTTNVRDFLNLPENIQGPAPFSTQGSPGARSEMGASFGMSML